MTYDTLRQKIVLFGGEDSSTTYLNDTWEYDGDDWVRTFSNDASQTDRPSQRHGHMVAYDEAQGLTFLFGGATTIIQNCFEPNPCNYLDDMWTYDGTQWTQITYNGVRPPKRAFGTMVYDAARQVMVLFGGRGDQAHQHSDTWEYDGVSWSQVSTAHIPPARKSHKMVYDRGLGASVIYGGSAGGVFSDVWRYDGIDWVEWRLESKPGHGTIKERFDHAMAYDEAHGKMVCSVVSNKIVMNT